MDRLLDTVLDAFEPADDWEFSAEIDPTDASDEVLASLADHGLNRASVGVQDSAPDIQHAIGRVQSYEDTARVVSLTYVGKPQIVELPCRRRSLSSSSTTTDPHSPAYETASYATLMGLSVIALTA